MEYFIVALILQIILLVYFQLITLIPMYPWNDLTKYTNKERLLEATVNGIVIIVSTGLFVTKVKWLMICSVIIWLLFLMAQLLTWWMPYLTGKHLQQFPRELYETHFKNTYKILPPIKNHIIPDAQHNLLQIITLMILIVSVLAI